MKIVITSGLVVVLALAAGSGWAATLVFRHSDGSAVVQDTQITRGSPTNNSGGAYSMSPTSYVEPNGSAATALVSFDNLAIPPGETIVSATLQLYALTYAWVDSNADGQILMGATALQVPFVEMEATANSNSNASAWETPMARGAGDRAAAPDDVITIQDPNSAGEGYVLFDVTASFSNQYTSGNYYGWAVDYLHPVDNDGRIGFRPRELGSAQEPVLIVEYFEPPRMPSAPNLVFDWGVREANATSNFNPDVEHIPHPDHDWPLLHQYNTDSTWLYADANDRMVGLMLRHGTTAPYDGTSSNTLGDALEWMSTNHVTLDYVFADVESATTTYTNTVVQVNLVRQHPDSRINEARVIQYAYYPGEHDVSQTWPWTTNRASRHADYMSSGVDVAQPNCYPYEYQEVHTWPSQWGSYVCPDKRSALFWAPLERFSTAKRNLPVGHELIPFLSGFIPWLGYDAPEPPEGDRKALLQHMRLRGSDGYYRLDSGVTNLTEEAHRAELLDAWHALDAFFATPGAAEILTLDTDKTSGVNWSAMRKGQLTRVLISNLSASDATVDFPPEIPELPDFSPVVPAGSHAFFEYPSTIVQESYSLTVQAGSGDGAYLQDEVVMITANPPPPGELFNGWAGDIGTLADLSTATTWLLMPPSNITVWATYNASTIPYAQMTVTSSGFYTGAEDDDVFNSAGMTADTHNESWGDMWLSDANGPAGRWIKVDLGGTNTLSHLKVWNYNQVGLPTRGVAFADIYVALSDPGVNTDGSEAAFNTNGWTLALKDQPFRKSPGGSAIAATDEHIDLGDVDAAFLAIRVNDSHGSGFSDVGLSEVQIYTSSAPGDEDYDGLPTDWETPNTLDPNDDGSADPDQGADGDPDLDGANNYEELVADTHPNDSNSLFTATAIVAYPNGTVDVDLESSSERDYLLHGKDDLSSTQDWSVLDGPTAGNGGAMTFTDGTAPAAGDRAYRLEVQMP